MRQVDFYELPACWDWHQSIRPVEVCDGIAENILTNLNDLGVAKFPAEPLVFELGCGDGSMLEGYQRHGCKLAGVDMSHEALRRARKLLPDASFVRCDINDFTCAEYTELLGRADLLLMLGSMIAHLSVADQAASVRRICAEMKSGAVLLSDTSFSRVGEQFHSLVVTDDYTVFTIELGAQAIGMLFHTPEKGKVDFAGIETKRGLLNQSVDQLLQTNKELVLGTYSVLRQDWDTLNDIYNSAGFSAVRSWNHTADNPPQGTSSAYTRYPWEQYVSGKRRGTWMCVK